MGPLSSDGQAAAVTQTAIGAHFDQSLDVEGQFLAQIAFDGAFFFKDLSDVTDFFLAQVGHLLIGVDPGAVQDRVRASAADVFRCPDCCGMNSLM